MGLEEALIEKLSARGYDREEIVRGLTERGIPLRCGGWCG